MVFGHRIRGSGNPKAFRGFWYGLGIGALAWLAFGIFAVIYS
jgi:hypothetical protein